MTSDEREAVLLETYERAAEDLARELEVQLARLRALMPEVERRLQRLRRHTAELEARLAA